METIAKSIDYSIPDLVTSMAEDGVRPSQHTQVFTPPDKLVDREMTVDEMLGLGGQAPVDASNRAGGKAGLAGLITTSNLVLVGLIGLALFLFRKLGD